MRDRFEKIFVDPETGNPLQYDPVTNLLLDTKTGKTYPVRGTLVELLPGQPLPTTDPLHVRHHTSFDYRNHYQRDAELFNYFTLKESAATRDEKRRVREAIIRHIPHDAELLLDVGCGNGWLAKYAIARGKHIISMDISTVNPMQVVEKYPSEAHLGLVADVFSLPLQHDSIDCIVASEIIEHVSDPVRFVQTLYASLKPGGILIITTPWKEKIEYSLCVHCNLPTPRYAHIHAFDETNVLHLFPGGSQHSWYPFSNMYLARLRTYVLLRYAPYRVWRLFDRCVNAIAGRPMRLMMLIEKPRT